MTPDRPSPLGALAGVLRGTLLRWPQLETSEAAFLEACAAEDVASLVYHQLRDTPELATWPLAIRDWLQRKAHAAVAAELLVQRELVRVLDTLGTRRVQPILLKGTALAYTLYPHPSLRPRCDTDLLIPRGDASLVQETLEGLGFRPAVQCQGEQLFRQFELARADELGLVHALDFHWKISAQALFADALTYQELASTAVPVPTLGGRGLAPAPTDALLLALIHPVMHHRNEQRLIWTYDVHLLASRLGESDFQLFTDRALEKRLGAICARGLEAAQRHFETQVPRRVLDRLHRQPLALQPSAAYLEPGRTWTHETVANVRGLKNWRDRLRLLREIAFPAPSYLLRSYGVGGSGLSRAILPALYLHRGVRGLVRALSGRK